MLLNCGVEKTLESPLSWKEIKPVNPKGSQSWLFIGRTDAEAEAPILCPPDAKNWLIGKGPDAGTDWGPEKGQQRTKWLDGITNLIDRNVSKPQEMVKEREAWHVAIHGVSKIQTGLSYWQQMATFFFFLKGCSSWYTCSWWKCSLLLSR